MERIGDALLLGQARAGNRAHLIRAVAVGFLDRDRIDPPEAGKQCGRFLWLCLHPFAGLGEFCEDRIEDLAMLVSVRRRGEVVALVAGEAIAAVGQDTALRLVQRAGQERIPGDPGIDIVADDRPPASDRQE